MNLRDRLKAIADALPEDASITLSVGALRGLAEADAIDDDGCLSDLTVEEVAQHLKRSPQTVRRLIREGALRAYVFQGRAYRITLAALQDFMEEQRNEKPPALLGMPTVGATDLGRWRRLRP